jgi:hypothetical protein
MAETRGPNEERLLERIGDTGADSPQEGGGGGGTELDESYVAPEREESDSYVPPSEGAESED